MWGFIGTLETTLKQSNLGEFAGALGIPCSGFQFGCKCRQCKAARNTHKDIVGYVSGTVPKLLGFRDIKVEENVKSAAVKHFISFDSTIISVLNSLSNNSFFGNIQQKTGFGGISIDLFDPSYDYDYTNASPQRKKVGGEEYDYPVGYVAYALKVLGRYKNDDWINGEESNEKNTNEKKKQWAIAFHGTGEGGMKGIPGNGYKIGENNHFGEGVYCTPTLSVAEGYARSRSAFYFKGEKYFAIFMNRVKPAGFEKASSQGGPDDFWVVKDVQNIRPYKLLIKKE